MESIPSQRTCSSFFMHHKSFNKLFQFLLYKTNRLHFFMRVYCNRSLKTSQRVKNNRHATRLRLVYFLFVIRCDIISDLLQYTRRGKCNLCVNHLSPCSALVRASHWTLDYILYTHVTFTHYLKPCSTMLRAFHSTDNLENVTMQYTYIINTVFDHFLQRRTSFVKQTKTSAVH